MISSPKAMIIIFWSRLGIPVIQAIPPKMPFASEFLVDAILYMSSPSQLVILVDGWFCIWTTPLGIA
jgi:hypothetical protein